MKYNAQFFWPFRILSLNSSDSFAYVEFVDKSSIVNALRLDGTTFKGRRIKVLPKRQNVPAARGLRGRIRSASRGRSSYGTSFRISGRGRFGRKGR